MEEGNDFIDLTDRNTEQNNENLPRLDDMILNNAKELDNFNINISTQGEENIANQKFSSNKPNENEPLTNKIADSGVIQVPNEEKNKSISIDNTLNESILTTIYRDLFLISVKLKYVIKPYGSKEKKNYHIKQWDLWGPLLLNMFLACTLAFNSEEKSQMIILIFVIFWVGGVIIFLNAYFLGVKSSIFQILCLLGYCLFPLNLSGFCVTFFKIKGVLRFLIVLITCLWSIYSSNDFLDQLTNNDQRYLVEYPCILFYLYIAWFIISS